MAGGDVFALDKIVFAINEGENHWVCAVAFVQKKMIQFFDSMGGKGIDYLDHIFHYIQDVHQDKKPSPLPDVQDWSLIQCTPATPKQTNGTWGGFCLASLLHCTPT
jgi:Ulp1 family protease